MPRFLAHTDSRVRSIHQNLSAILTFFFVIILWPQSISLAVDIGSQAPALSLADITGKTVTPQFPSDGAILILYFFDVSDETLETVSLLKQIASKSPGNVSFLGITRENPGKLKGRLGARSDLASVILADNRGATLAYGLRKNLPAAVVVGPGGIVGGVLAPGPAPRQIAAFSAESFLALDLPQIAVDVYKSLPDGWSAEPEIMLGWCYASVLAGDTEAALSSLRDLAGSPTSFAREAHAALALHEFRQGRDSNAIAECGKAPGNGFADYIAGKANARAGQCAVSKTHFNRVEKGQFLFGWQRALALNMVARVAEEKGSDLAAQKKLRAAWILAPFNCSIAGNLLASHWRHDNVPGALAYARTIKRLKPHGVFVQVLLNEFEEEMAFNKDASAQKYLEKRVGAKGSRASSAHAKAGGKRQLILVPDLSIVGCTQELSFLPLATAGLLRQSLEADGKLVTVRRPEIVGASKVLRIKKENLTDPLQLLHVARSLSADLMVVGELGNYEGEYVLNIRIVDVITENVIAISAERFATLEELGPAIRKSASILSETM